VAATALQTPDPWRPLHASWFFHPENFAISHKGTGTRKKRERRKPSPTFPFSTFFVSPWFMVSFFHFHASNIFSGIVLFMQWTAQWYLQMSRAENPDQRGFLDVLSGNTRQ
jgi:hypothetical protein